MAPAAGGSPRTYRGEAGEVEVFLHLADVALLRRALPERHALLEELEEASADQGSALSGRFCLGVRLPMDAAQEKGRRKTRESPQGCCGAEVVARVAEYVLAKVACVLRWHCCLPLASGLWEACAGLCASGCFPRSEHAKHWESRDWSTSEADDGSGSGWTRGRKRQGRWQAERPERFWAQGRPWAELARVAAGGTAKEPRRLSLPWEELPSECLPRLCEALDSRPAEDELQARFSKLLHERCFLCNICAQWRERKHHQVCPRGHAWCSHCFARWAAQPQQLGRMARLRSLSVECLHSCSVGCPELLPEAYTRAAGRCSCGRRTCACGPLPRLCKDLEYRRHLISRAGGRRCVDCPQPGCIGVAYSGGPKLMCFLCEHQWSSKANLRQHFALVGLASLLLVWPCGRYEKMMYSLALLAASAVIPAFTSAAATTVARRRRPALPEGCKRCPCCGMVIFKSGGCDHMTCRCGHEFWWTTMRPYPTCQ